VKCNSAEIRFLGWFRSHDHSPVSHFPRRFNCHTSSHCLCLVKCFSNQVISYGMGECRVRLKPDGTLWRMGGEVKGKLANGVGSQYSHTTSEHGVSSITIADAHTSAASSRLNWRPRRFKWTRLFRRKTKSGFCACAITFQTQSTSHTESLLASRSVLKPRVTFGWGLHFLNMRKKKYSDIFVSYSEWPFGGLPVISVVKKEFLKCPGTNHARSKCVCTRWEIRNRKSL